MTNWCDGEKTADALLSALVCPWFFLSVALTGWEGGLQPPLAPLGSALVEWPPLATYIFAYFHLNISEDIHLKMTEIITQK